MVITVSFPFAQFTVGLLDRGRATQMSCKYQSADDANGQDYDHILEDVLGECHSA